MAFFHLELCRFRILSNHLRQVVKDLNDLPSGCHFARLMGPKFGTHQWGVAIGICSELMTAWAEYEVDLVVSRQKPLSMLERFEVAEYFLLFSGAAMRNLDRIIQFSMCSIIRVSGQGLEFAE